MHNLFKKTAFILLWTIFSASGAEEAIQKKMGLELELQGVIYQKPDTIALQDHVRLFESNQKLSGTEKPLWYLEVDGSGNLEFVTEPFIVDGGCEAHILEVIGQMQYLLRFCLDAAAPSDTGLSFRIPQTEFSHNMGGVGKWVHKSPTGGNITKDIIVHIQNPTWRVRPQITFQIPLELILPFTLHMAYEHNSLTKTVNTLIDNGYFPSDIFERPFSPGAGLAFLTILYAERLSNNHDADELGPKGVLTLMSRLSFSSMYAKLTHTEQGRFHTCLEKYLAENETKGLFKKAYSLFYGKDLGKHPEIMLPIINLKINDFIRSIIEPGFFGENIEASKVKFKEILLATRSEVGIIAQGVIDEELANIEAGKFGFKGTDLVSPPPFIRHTYSMGKYEAPHPETAVLEMRGYSIRCKTPLRMDETIIDWVREEITAALVSWSPSKSLRRMIKGNLEASFSIINEFTPDMDIKELKEKLNLPATRSYHASIVDFLKLLTVHTLGGLKPMYVNLLKSLN